MLAAASRAHAHAVAEGDSSLGSTPFRSSISNRPPGGRRKSKKTPLPNILQYASNMLVLHLNNTDHTNEKKKRPKPKKVGGWYEMSPDGLREDTRSPLSWKDILENPANNLERYSEYARQPKGGHSFLPSRKHRRVHEAELDAEIDPDYIKEKYKQLKM